MTDPLRILVITNDYPTINTPGNAPCIKDQVTSIQELGHSVDVYYIDPSNKLNYFSAALKVFLLSFKSKHYDIIHAYYGHCGVIARFQTRIPVVVTFRGSDLLSARDGPIGKIAAKLASSIIVMTEEMKLESGRSDAAIIPFGVNTDIFHPTSKKQARQELGLPLDTKIVLFPWNPARTVKRFDIVQAAIDILRKDHKNIDLLTLFGKPHSVVARYMNACDVMVLASDHEGAPMAIREALACHLPVVSVDVGDVRQVIQEIDGCYLSDRSPEAMAEKIYLALNSTRTAQNWPLPFSVDSVSRQVLDVYRRAIG
jgi:glycosyltransferase involved in cell wall biosynthesis